MREIKFRAWNKETKYMIVDSSISMSSIMRDNIGKRIDPNGVRYDRNYIVMQHTGLKDVNGKEIYEGDVIIGKAEIPCVVVWDNDNACFKANATHTKLVGISAIHFTRREVIGNIYANPELLKDFVSTSA